MTTEGRLLKLSNGLASKAFGWKSLVLDQRGPRKSVVMRLMNRIFLWEFMHRYGYIPPGGDLSITEIEYHYAVEHKKPVFCFVVDEDYPWRPGFIEGEPARVKLKTFKEKIRFNEISRGNHKM